MPCRMNSRLIVLIALSWPSQMGTAVKIRIDEGIVFRLLPGQVNCPQISQIYTDLHQLVYCRRDCFCFLIFCFPEKLRDNHMKKSEAFRAILTAGLVVGVLDISSAFVIWWQRGVGARRGLQGIST